MTEQKAIKEYNETSKIIENKFKEIDLIKFLFEGNRISIKKEDLGKNFYHVNDADYEKIFNKDYEYVLEYGIINDINDYEKCSEYYKSKEEWEKVYNKGFKVELYPLDIPYVPFQIQIGKKELYNNINSICKFLIENNIHFKKLEVDKELELKLNEQYKDKQIHIEDLDIYANIENVYKIDDKIILGVEGWNGNFLIDIEKTILVKDKKDLESYQEKSSLADCFDFKG